MASQASLDIRGRLSTLRARKNVMQLRGRVIAVRKQRSAGPGGGKGKKKEEKKKRRNKTWETFVFFFSSFFFHLLRGVLRRVNESERFFFLDADLSRGVDPRMDACPLCVCVCFFFFFLIRSLSYVSFSLCDCRDTTPWRRSV